MKKLKKDINQEVTQLRILRDILKDKHTAGLLEDVLGITKITLSSWIYTLKHVPLVHVGKVSRLLGISPYVLNYKQVFDFYGEGPTLEDVIKKCKYFSPVDVSRILQED